MKFLRQISPVFIIVLIAVILSFLNYQPNTWLTGWDNLHPEFDFQLYFNRYLDSTWAEYRGLGLLSGIAESADLIRLLPALLLSKIVPAQTIRYLLTFISLVVGPIGVYFLTKSTLLKRARFDTKTVTTASFFAGLFYLHNLGTLQNFYTPLEAFTWFYMSLPWLILVTIHYLNQPTKKSFIYFVVVNLLATPSFFIQTFFVVYTICLVPITIHYVFTNRLKSLRSLSLLILTTSTLHAFWLIPNLYFTFTASSIAITAHQNQIATPEVIARNQEYGNLSNVALLKGFWFDYTDLNSSTNKFELMMGPWIDHLDQPVVLAIGYLLFALVAIGLFYALKKRLPYAWAFAGIFFISIFFLINNNFPTGPLFSFLQEHVPLLRQFFRSVYTKWSVPAALSFSLFFAIGVIFLLDLFSTLHYHLTTLITSFTLGFMLIVFTGPMFQGHLIYPAMRQSIPDAYFQLFDFFKTQDKNTRIANLPQHTLWGWEFYNWGYRGSGFLWYGIEQPILDRAFDTWSAASESYYHEISRAIYAQDLTQLENLIDKYQINWFVLDRSIIIPGSDSQKALYLPEIDSFMNRSSRIAKAAEFDFITVYQTNPNTKPNNFFNTLPFTPTKLNLIDPQLNLSDFTFTETTANNRTTANSEVDNCDPFNDTLFTKTTTPDGVMYTAVNANACDHLNYPELPHAYGYEIEIEHKNLAGQPLLVCFESYTSNTCLTYNYLEKPSQTLSDSDWITSTLSIPPMNPNEYGYALHIYNYSIGSAKTSNIWRSIKTKPIRPSAFDLDTKSELYPYTLLTDSQKRTYSLYTASTNSSQPNSLLVLNQSYDQGWQAYSVGKLITNLPTWFLYLNTLLLAPVPESNHIVANGWANGWLLPQGKTSLIIVYKPQLLQYLGFALLFTLPIIWILHPRHQNED